jgi:hypothetical protein
LQEGEDQDVDEDQANVDRREADAVAVVVADWKDHWVLGKESVNGCLVLAAVPLRENYRHP